MQMKKVLFVLGSPSGDKSASKVHASYVSKLLACEYELISLYQPDDPTRPRLSEDAQILDDFYHEIVEKIRRSHCVVWVCGAQCFFIPVQMQYLFDKLFAQNQIFEGKISGTLLTSFGILDDALLERMKFINEQLGFGYIGDVSLEGSPFNFTSQRAESDCQAFAYKINGAIQSGYLPSREYQWVERDYLSPIKSGKNFQIRGAAAEKDGGKTIVLIVGTSIDKNPSVLSTYEAIRHYSRNTVELVELDRLDINPCVYCRRCVFETRGICCFNDQYDEIADKMHRSDGIIYIANCVSGLIDARLRTFISRTGKILNQPTLRGKHGFAVTLGGGSLGPSASEYLDKILRKYGVCTIGTVAEGEGGTADLDQKLEWTVKNLDEAIENNWLCADRFSAIGEQLILKDYVQKYGFLIRGNYKFFRKNKILRNPSRILILLMYMFFFSKKLRDYVEQKITNHYLKQKEKTLLLT